MWADYKHSSALQLVCGRGYPRRAAEKCWSGAETGGRAQNASLEVVSSTPSALTTLRRSTDNHVSSLYSLVAVKDTGRVDYPQHTLELNRLQLLRTSRRLERHGTPSRARLNNGRSQAVMKEKAAHLTRLRVLIRLPLPTFKKPTTRLNGDALCCARLGHLEKTEEIASAVPKERLVQWCGPVGPRAEGHRWGHGAEVPQRIPGHSRAALSLSKNVGGCRGMETDGYAPILLNANTSRLSSASHLCTFSLTSWLRPRAGRAHQARAARR